METDEIEAKLGKQLFDHQYDALAEMHVQVAVDDKQPRMLVHYPTGKGKSVTALACLAWAGIYEALVITPPSTYNQWRAMGAQLGINVECMSHQKFRMKGTLLSKHKAIVADEFHLFGGHGGQGWKKLERLAQGLQAPLIMMSATPNYNDAERVYCVQKILDPYSVKGGYINFLVQNCRTEPDRFSMIPKVIGFLNYSSAAEYLAALPGVVFMPDDLVYSIEDIEIAEKIPSVMTTFGYNPRRHRMIASGMEERHTRIDLSLINENGHIEADVMDEFIGLLTEQSKPVLVFAVHSTVAKALGRTLGTYDISHYTVHGQTPLGAKEHAVQQFIAGEYEVLIGTASLATGTDGLDKVCDTLIILDDTDDDALRRQLVGRIMPRGEDTDTTGKQVYRFVLS